MAKLNSRKEGYQHGVRGVSLRVNPKVEVTPYTLTETLVPFIKCDFTFQKFYDFSVEMLVCCHLNYLLYSSAVKQRN